MIGMTVWRVVADVAFDVWMVSCGVLIGMMLTEHLLMKDKKSTKQDKDEQGGESK